MRIVLLSDVHLGMSQARSPDGVARGVTKAVDRIATLRPDRVVIVGDLVDTGRAEEYDEASGLLAPLAGRLAGRLAAVAGNHEVLAASLEEFRRLPFARSPGVEATDGLTLLYLNTAVEGLPAQQWYGQLDDASLSAAAGVADDGPLLAFAHHPLPDTVRPGPHPMMHAINGDRLMSRLAARQGQTVLFTGHVHLQDVVRRGRVTCVSLAPLSFWPHAVTVADWDGVRLSVRTERLGVTVEESPDPDVTHTAYVAEHEPAVPSLSVRLTSG